VEFLGVENMLAIICGSRSAAECIGIPRIGGGALNKSKGLTGFAGSHDLRISGRYRVITLIDDFRYNNSWFLTNLLELKLGKLPGKVSRKITKCTNKKRGHIPRF